MLLKPIESRRARLRGLADGSASGFALITVIGIMAVTAIIAIAITSSAISAVSFTTSTRASVQARATADAGIDTAWVAMSGGAFTCTGSGSMVGGTFTTTTAYFDAANHALSCAGSVVSGTPAKAVVNSTGVAANAGVAGGSSGNNRTITALFNIVVSPSTVTLNKALFSEGDVQLTNNVNILDPTGNANLYSNGNVSCAANDPLVQGSVFVQGNFSGPNKCQVMGTVWAGGEVSLTSQVVVRGDVYSAGGAPGGSPSINLNTSFVGGTVVANGDVEIAGNGGSQYCPLNGYNAKVCGSILSLESTVSVGGGANVGGGLYARDTVNLGNVHDDRIVGGNVVSTNGALLAQNIGSSGYNVGGFVAVAGASDLVKARIGNPASSCSSSSGFTLCSPAHPAIPMAAIPAPLNFPTNTRVVAPPRESLPRIDMYPDAGLAAKWAGWTVQHVSCADIHTTIAAGWVGKLLLVVDGCTAPISWENAAGTGNLVLTGDLAIFSSAGFTTGNNVVIKSSVAGTSHTLLWVVPSDAKTVAGTALATWTAPIPAQPTYTKPTCDAGNYGDIRINNGLTITDTKSFLYTPCDLSMTNHIDGFTGQMYSGTSAMPSNSSFTMQQISVPGASVPGAAAATISATETARFDARVP